MGNQSLNCILQAAKTEMIISTQSIMSKYKLPACLMDGILSSLMADIRLQEATELVMNKSEEDSPITKENKADIPVEKENEDE